MTKGYNGKALYTNICQDIKEYSENKCGLINTKHLKDVKLNALNSLDALELCSNLEVKYNIDISSDNLSRIKNLENLASCVCGLILTKNLQR